MAQLKPARPPSVEDDLQSIAAYLSYEEPAQSNEIPASLLSPASIAPSTKSPDRANQVSPKPKSPSPASPKNAEDEGYEDMIYALSLADRHSPVAPPTNTIRPSGPSNPTSPSPQLRFLTKPPPSSSASPQSPSASLSPEPLSANNKTSFPSSFAAGKKSAGRLAAAQAAQASGKAAGFRPGKPGRNSRPAAQKKPPTSWNSDSDDEEDEDKNEEEEEDEDEDEEEDERLKKYRSTMIVMPPPTSHVPSDRGLPPSQERKNLHPLQTSREGAYSIYSTSGYPPQDGRPISQAVNQGTEMGQFPNAAARREVPAVLRDQPAAETAENDPSLRPAFSQHGLLHRVMQERQEKSAKSIQEAAHYTGEPLVQVQHKAPPIQSGLLGAIASHERDRKRDGGMGAVLTERARERALRQRETDELHRQSMFMMHHPMGFHPNAMMMNQQPMMPMMFNPQMVPPGGPTYEQMLFQQHQMQMQQQAYAQQCYMAQYGYPGMGQQGGGMMTPQQAGAPAGVGVGVGGGGGGMMNGHQSMYGFPAGLQQPQMAFHPALPHQSSSALSPPFLNNNPAAPQSPSHAHSPASSTSSPLKNSQHQHHHPAAAANHYSYHP